MNRIRKFIAKIIFGTEVQKYDEFVTRYNSLLENEKKLVDINRSISKHYDELIVKYDKLVHDYDHALTREYELINVAKNVNESCMHTTTISNKILDSLYEYQNKDHNMFYSLTLLIF